MSNKKENSETTQKRKKIVSFVAVLFIVGLIINVAMYRFEQYQAESAMHERHEKQKALRIVELAPQSSSSSVSGNASGNSSATMPPMMGQMPMGNPSQNSEQNAEGTAPKLSEGAMLPSDIPPEMLKALQERGMTVEDLQKASQNMGASGMGSSMNGNTMGSGMGDGMQNSAFPEAMQKALAEREAQKQAQENMKEEAQNPE